MNRHTFLPVSFQPQLQFVVEPMSPTESWVLARCGHPRYQRQHICLDGEPLACSDPAFSDRYHWWLSVLPNWLTSRWQPALCAQCDYQNELRSKAVLCACCGMLILPNTGVRLSSLTNTPPDFNLERATRVAGNFVCCLDDACEPGPTLFTGIWTGAGVLITS